MYYITWKEGFLYLWSLGCQQCLSPAPKLKEKSVQRARPTQFGLGQMPAPEPRVDLRAFPSSSMLSKSHLGYLKPLRVFLD